MNQEQIESVKPKKQKKVEVTPEQDQMIGILLAQAKRSGVPVLQVLESRLTFLKNRNESLVRNAEETTIDFVNKSPAEQSMIRTVAAKYTNDVKVLEELRPILNKA